MSDFQPIPVFVKQSEINQVINQWEERKNYFQAIVNRFKLLNLEAPLLENELHDLLNTPKEFIAKKITQDAEFSLGGMKIDAEKAFDLLEKPVGTIELIDYIENSKKQTNSNWAFYRHAYLFVIIDGLVEIKPSELEKIKSQYTVFLTNQKEKDIYDLLSNLCDSINGLNDLKKIYNIDDKLFTELIQTNSQTGVVSIRENFLTTYNR